MIVPKGKVAPLQAVIAVRLSEKSSRPRSLSSVWSPSGWYHPTADPTTDGVVASANRVAMLLAIMGSMICLRTLIEDLLNSMDNGGRASSGVIG
jgi:hypothetical protein